MLVVQCDNCHKTVKENSEMCIGSFQFALMKDGKIRKIREKEPYIVQGHYCSTKCFSESFNKTKK